MVVWLFDWPRRSVNGLVGCLGGGRGKRDGQYARESNPVGKKTSLTEEAAADLRELMRQQVNA